MTRAGRVRSWLAATWDLFKWMAHYETYRHCPEKYEAPQW